MKFREFFDKCKFTLYATGDSNWDLYAMQFNDDAPVLAALAKDGTGAADCFYGNIEWLERQERRGIHHGFTRVAQEAA
jgi:hypothetical protein